MVLTKAACEFILHWGEMGSRWGVNRTVAQMHALLYLSAEPLTAEDIAEALSVARSNVSSSLRELQNWQLVQATHQMGDRRDFFSTSHDAWQLNLSLHALLHHGEKELPRIVRSREEIAAVAHLMRRLYQLPVLQLPQAGAHVGARYGERLRDVLGGERLRRKVQQRVHLRHGAVHAPSAAHFAPVKYELARRLRQYHNRSLLYCNFSIDRNYRCKAT